MNNAYIALGANIKPRDYYMEQAIKRIKAHNQIDICATSAVYETAPAGYEDQGHFLNSVIHVQTSLDPFELLTFCQSVEHYLGRKRTIRYGPRTIDLDILLYNHENIETKRLTIPHPRMHKRAFVLVPLKELAPDLVVPGKNKNVADLVNDLPEADKRDVVIWKPTG